MLRIFAFALVVTVLDAEVLNGVTNLDNSFEPMVAFKCGQPSMFRTADGWQADTTRNCLSTSAAILSYCLAKYPNQTIKNVIPASSEETISLWPTFTDKTVNQSFTVRPYRCMPGSFESDTLVVPSDCRYTVYRNSDTPRTCLAYFQWNASAQAKCANTGNLLYSFSVFESCESGLFAAIEYVCCPSGSSQSPAPVVGTPASVDFPALPTGSAQALTDQIKTETPVEDEEETDYGYFYVDGDEESYPADQNWPYEEDDADMNDYDYSQDYEEETGAGDDVDNDEADDDDAIANEYDYVLDYEEDDEYDPSKNYYLTYMDTPEQLGATEHEAYTKAVRFTKRYYDSEKQRLMQQLAEIEVRANDFESRNVTAAHQIRAQGIATIKHLYDTTDQTWKAVKQAMYDEHQLRVESDLENIRLEAEDALEYTLEEAAEMDDLEALDPLFRALKRYVRSEEKERIHWINRYEHLLDTDPNAAERIRLTVQEILTQIQQRLDSISSSLKRVPRLASIIHTRLQEFMKMYADVDQEIQLLFPNFDLLTRVPQLNVTFKPKSAQPSQIPVQEDEVVTSDSHYSAAMEPDVESFDPAVTMQMNLYPQTGSHVLFDFKIVPLVGVLLVSGIFLVIVITICICYCRRGHAYDKLRSQHSKPMFARIIDGSVKQNEIDDNFAASESRVFMDLPRLPYDLVYAQTTRSNEPALHCWVNPMESRIDLDESAELVNNDVLDEAHKSENAASRAM